MHGSNIYSRQRAPSTTIVLKYDSSSPQYRLTHPYPAEQRSCVVNTIYQVCAGIRLECSTTLNTRSDITCDWQVGFQPGKEFRGWNLELEHDFDNAWSITSLANDRSQQRSKLVIRFNNRSNGRMASREFRVGVHPPDRGRRRTPRLSL